MSTAIVPPEIPKVNVRLSCYSGPWVKGKLWLNITSVATIKRIILKLLSLLEVYDDRTSLILLYVECFGSH